ncbi:uncharacterized protein STEHIDRAFT_170063 [Stereum hirsutum FP-91666 SS1]|uniref:uncharacterized protein n=1 Tax=Stereum hirsutum (strain FP-91666) TaxID=721885 RepID=UPI000444A0C1|nr:uncharacterized protein STEHIDRAFT_170063 [Stereum hirsutum FP-91666 SS1]EIM84347.1 hypothetical protein STEHIDRAFT_170063 [Stereum hirsutum FP-91666 SS1]
MALVAFTFGSLGDIIAVIDLLNEVRKALSDSTGSSAEYQALLISLDIFHDTLEAVRDTFSTASPSLRNHTPLLPSLQNAHRQALSVSRALLKDIHARIAKYQASLRKGGSGSMMRDSWRKIGWALFQKPELEEMKMKMMAQVETLNILLSLALRHDVRQQHAAVLEMDRSVQQLPILIQETIAEQRTVLFEIKHCVNELPNTLGCTWEGGMAHSQRPVVLRDALGQTLNLPLEFCESYDLLDGILKVYYRKRAGGRFVERGDYELTIPGDEMTDGPESASTSLVQCQKERQHERAYVSHRDDREWRDLVKAGISIDMNVIVREKVDVAGLEDMHSWERARQRCPNCSFDNSKPPNGSGPRRSPRSRWTDGAQGIKCEFCQVWFHINSLLPSNDPELEASISATGQNTEGETEELVSSQTQKQRGVRPLRTTSLDEVRFLRRLRVVKSLPRPSATPNRRRFPNPTFAGIYYMRAVGEGF